MARVQQRPAMNRLGLATCLKLAPFGDGMGSFDVLSRRRWVWSARVVSLRFGYGRCGASPHNPKVAGSNPAPATKKLERREAAPGVFICRSLDRI